MSTVPVALLSLLFAAAALADDPPRPRLQFINGSTQPADIFWLKSDTERVPNGSVEPGKDTFITTTLGHRFVIVGREDKAEATVTCLVPVQACASIRRERMACHPSTRSEWKPAASPSSRRGR
jgi:hypothetical protein